MPCLRSVGEERTLFTFAFSGPCLEPLRGTPDRPRHSSRAAWSAHDARVHSERERAALSGAPGRPSRGTPLTRGEVDPFLGVKGGDAAG